MIYREFGNTSFKTSTIGMGTYYDMRWIFKTYLGIYSGKDQKIDAYRAGIDNGINLIDTAELYRTEKLVGTAIKSYKRDELFIATKVFPTHLSPKSLEKALNRSLKNLDTDYIDLYQIHFPNPAVDLKKTMRTMEKMIDTGKMRHIGVSNFTLNLLKRAQGILSKYEITSIQINYNVFHRNSQKAMIDYCNKNHIAVMAYFPLGHGKVTQPQFNKYFDHVRKTIGDVPNANIALAYLISRNQNVFPIPRASNRAHVLQNAKNSDILLNEDDIKYLEKNL
ncbi:aldo/keto reductase [Ferroplasma acidiphilum]|jgi:diketogulonate reductase-like aldo/keto reductase|uniref:Aldo/keto reductase n=1 Tax=Ferroplasma acidiphilum TaxID=74969 RepID=A0A7K4FLU7_9ARCH|nr:aldo/keto reductase [Ferroplasma acidiphilum]MCL4348857.1 aldo/keto reductase [Candidatus Thermoplasmatota archaeon]NOL59761.1 aldo/keto reductase [Ferroplasma acidiphilum]